MKNKIITMTILSTMLGVSLTTLNKQNVDASSTGALSISTRSNDDYDVSTGWNVTDYSSSTGDTYNKFFVQGHSNLEQKMALANFGNIGKTTFTAEKIIPMKKGINYDIQLIYAMYYNLNGTGYIDFNGTRKDSDNNPADKVYTESITPTQDINYKITIHFEVSNNSQSTGYFKLGYALEGGGVTPEPVELDMPTVKKAPEANQKSIEGVADPKNTVIIRDSEDKEIGQDIVKEDGSFEIEASRMLIYNEKLYVTQTNGRVTSPSAEITVVDTIAPDRPKVNKVTDEDLSITGEAEPNSEIKVYINDDETYFYRTETQADGNYQLNLNKPFVAGTKLDVTATDKANNTSEPTMSKVGYAKELAIEEINDISVRDEEITGKVSRGNCEVQIIFNNSIIFKGDTDGVGNFSIGIKEPQLVGSLYKVKVTHKPSGETKELDKRVLPIPPSLPSILAGQNQINGTVDPYAEVSFTLLRDGKTQEFTSEANKNGEFSLSLEDDEGEKIYLQVGDQLIGKTLLTIEGEDQPLQSVELMYTIYSRMGNND